jgi:hypothetical protein
MRLKYFFTTFLALLLFLSNSKSVIACCEGKCNTSETCEYENCFTYSEWFSCDPNYKIEITCEAGSGGTYDPDAPYDWSPGGSPNTVCDKDCIRENGRDCRSGCVIETKSVWCGACNDPTPTPNPTSGGGGNPTAAPTASTVLISGSIQLDLEAVSSGNFCSQTPTSPLTIPNIDLYAHNIANYYPSTLNADSFTINTSYTGSNYTVILDLSSQTGTTDYVCSCPAPIDTDNPYLCSYHGVSSPRSNLNFYLKDNSLSNDSWFQVFNGNYFGRNGISSSVPYRFCSNDTKCIAALSAPRLIYSSTPSYQTICYENGICETFDVFEDSGAYTNLRSSGFAISNINNPNDVRSSSSDIRQHSYFHLPTRPNNVNSYDATTDLAQLSYDYFYRLAENQVQAVGNGEDLEPLLGDWTNSAWWNDSDVNYIKVDGNVSIDESQGFNLSSGQKLVVFLSLSLRPFFEDFEHKNGIFRTLIEN